MSVNSTGNSEKVAPYQYCKKIHWGQFRFQSNLYYGCGGSDHYVRECLQNANQASLDLLYTRVPLREDEESLDVIARTVELNSYSAYALIDSGAIHSFVCATKIDRLSMKPENVKSNLVVSNPIGKNMPINLICKECPITIRGIPFPIDLYVLPNCEFDLILGLDWLSEHQAWIDCYNRRLYLRGLSKDSILLIDKKPTSIFVAMALQDEYDFGLSSMPMVSKFVDVFPKELPGLPLTREVEFRIDIQPGTNPVSITPYRMTPIELKEPEKQLEELQSKGFI
ncbi:hypothetical protein V6N13_019822 [Hibiscus sabdariffa]